MEKKIFKDFYHIWAWQPFWSMDHAHFSKEAPNEIWAALARRLQRKSHLKLSTFFSIQMYGAHTNVYRSKLDLAVKMLHYESTPIQIYWNFPPKNENFQIKNSDIFHISAHNIDCGYSLEPPRRRCSNENPQFMFLSRNKKNNVYPCKPQFYYIKVGFKGVKVIKVWFRDDCQCMTIILATLVDCPFPMIYAKIQSQAILGFGE